MVYAKYTKTVTRLIGISIMSTYPNYAAYVLILFTDGNVTEHGFYLINT